MESLSIDLETRSSVDIGKSGVYRYAEAEDFAILLFGYSVDGGAVQVIDIANGEQIPQEILDALTDESVIKWAFNANFERVCLSRYLSDLGIALDPFHDNHPLSTECARFLSPHSWRCTMVWSAYMGLPLSLAGVGRVLGLEEQKMNEGKALIRYFSTPPFHEPTGAKWDLFKSYNRRDVEVEMAIQKRLSKYPVPQSVWEEYVLDQEINDRGIRLDMPLVENAVQIDVRTKEKLTDRLKTLTSLENPNSVTQMKAWLKEQGVETESLDKKSVTALLANVPDPLKEVLELRQQLAKSSVKKYQAMQNTVCSDGRARGMFQFYGANRTGRFSGRHIQLQNLPQNHLADLEYARSLVRQGSFAALELLYESVPDVLSQLIRTAFISKEGRKFIVADFSAIEARVLSWLAKERWRMDVFANDGDIYCATAGRMFHCNVVKHGENGHLRQYGKLAELSSGYGGSVGALKAFGALESGMKEEELNPLVDAWRAANPNIVDFWWAVDRATKDCIKERSTKVTHGIRFIYQGSMMFIELPCGRRLAYVKPRIGENQFGGESVTYMGLNLSKKWARIESYGPKLVENVTQAISRDILCYAMQTLRTMDIVAHVHDELIIECDERVSLSAICEQMARTPPWADGLPLRADGFECQFYQKD
ncbi:putative DNA-directed DNA polymerase [Selenomonas sp. oral taxon 137 str. F0430]|uniref:DNA polymerase n=1 Tax=Selenomonas sp. oral taxon 137 TaxID=712531 RepID=UPI0001EB1F0C|nr:DNA polymerase [Selenomonas sp. oral taxon 137]EFR40313.1 putative DNA-directed DNA polymerase [Selenomonas sp. oral taxon 137 str. F0430]